MFLRRLGSIALCVATAVFIIATFIAAFAFFVGLVLTGGLAPEAAMYLGATVLLLLVEIAVANYLVLPLADRLWNNDR